MWNKFRTEVHLFKEYLKVNMKIGYNEIMQSPLHINNALLDFMVRLKNTLWIQVFNVCLKSVSNMYVMLQASYRKFKDFM